MRTWIFSILLLFVPSARGAFTFFSEINQDANHYINVMATSTFIGGVASACGGDGLAAVGNTNGVAAGGGQSTLQAFYVWRCVNGVATMIDYLNTGVGGVNYIYDANPALNMLHTELSGAGRYSPYLLDSGNNPVLLTGNYWWTIPSGLIGYNAADLPPDYNLSFAVALAQSNNWNHYRFWQIEHAGSGTNYMARRYPWARPGSALWDGKGKFDLTTYTNDWFDALTNALGAFQRAGIYCSVQLLNGFSGDAATNWASTGLDRFPYSPHNTINNINAHVTTTNDWYGYSDPTWLGYMTNYAHKIVDVCQPYGNVIYEIGNEMPTRSTNLCYSLAQEVKSYENKTYGRSHPILLSAMSAGNTPLGDTFLTNVLTSSNVANIVAWGTNGLKSNPWPVTTAYPQIIDTDHVFANDGSVSNLCQAITRGWAGYWNMDGGTNQNPSVTTTNGGLRVALGAVRSFANYMNLKTAHASNSYSSTGFALTNTFGQTLVFAPTNTVNVTVTHAPGWLRWRWLEPETGNIFDNLYLETGNTDTWGVPSIFTSYYGMLLLEPTHGAGGIEFGVQTNDYIDCGNITGTTGSLTMSAWIMLNTNSLNTSQLNIMANGGSWLIVDKTRLDFSSAVKDNYGATNAIKNPYQWYHVCGTRSGSTYRLFVNGVQSGSNVTDSGSTATSFNFFIGSNGTHNLSWVGWIMDCQMYSRVLSDAEIYALSQTYGPINTANLIGWWPMTDGAQGAAMDTLTIKDKSGNGWNGTAHKGTGGAMVQRLGGPRLLTRR